METLSEIREEFARKLAANDFVYGTIEIVGATFEANEETIFGATNPNYIRRELDWYLSMSRNVNDIGGGVPKIWQQVSSNEGLINSNYGYLLISEENGSQLANVIKHLVYDPNTRRATAVYTRPEIHSDWNLDGMSDFICTNAVQYLIRDNKLDVVVQMRSNDAVFGYRNDYAWQKYMQHVIIDALAEADIQVKPGRIIWHVASLHVYERHWWLVDHYAKTGEFDASLVG